MHDPVITPAGYTYDRAEIERWIQLKGTDPSTNQTLILSQLVTNHSLRRLIINTPRFTEGHMPVEFFSTFLPASQVQDSLQLNPCIAHASQDLQLRCYYCLYQAVMHVTLHRRPTRCRARKLQGPGLGVS